MLNCRQSHIAFYQYDNVNGGDGDGKMFMGMEMGIQIWDVMIWDVMRMGTE